LEEVPELRPAYEEHLADNDELLPHVFFGDVSRSVVSRASAGDSDVVARILSCLERVLTEGDEQASELVVVSFVENIAPEDGAAAFFESWPPALRSWHARVWSGSRPEGFEPRSG
jgi:hypothetical protein